MNYTASQQRGKKKKTNQMTTEQKEEKRGKYGRIEEERAPFPGELRSDGERDEEEIHFSSLYDYEREDRIL